MSNTATTMAQQEERLSLGHYLQSLRVKKGLGLDDVCRNTHISRQNLIYIETDDHGRLPAQVHVKGFLKAYAELLDINPERLVQRYTEELMARKYSSGPYGLSNRFGFWVRFLFAIGLLFAVIGVTFYSAALWDRDSQELPALIDGLSDSRLNPSATIGSMNTDDALIPADESTDAGRLKLTVIALDTVQLKVIIDGQMPEAFRLNPDDRLDLEAGSDFNILLDNAAGVEVYFNEKPISLSGKSGQNVAIKLP